MTKRNGKVNRTLAALTAAIFSIVPLICGCAPELNNESKSEAANGEKILSGRDVSTDSPQPVNTPEKMGWKKGTIDSYIPAHESPRLDELYNSEIFSKLIPKTLLPGMQLDSSYLALYDPLANPKDNRYLQLCFKTADGKSTLKIYVEESNGDERLADPNDSSTYSLAHFLSMQESGASDLDIVSSMTCFLPHDLKREMFESLVYTFDDRRCKASVSILCGDRTVEYSYSGRPISPEDFYSMVVSAEIMQRS